MTQLMTSHACFFSRERGEDSAQILFRIIFQARWFAQSSIVIFGIPFELCSLATCKFVEREETRLVVWGIRSSAFPIQILRDPYDSENTSSSVDLKGGIDRVQYRLVHAHPPRLCHEEMTFAIPTQ